MVLDDCIERCWFKWWYCYCGHSAHRCSWYELSIVWTASLWSLESPCQSVCESEVYNDRIYVQFKYIVLCFLCCTIVLFNTFDSSRNHDNYNLYILFCHTYYLKMETVKLLILWAELTCLCLTVNMSGFLDNLVVLLMLILLLIFRVMYMRRFLKFMNFVSSLSFKGKKGKFMAVCIRQMHFEFATTTTMMTTMLMTLMMTTLMMLHFCNTSSNTEKYHCITKVRLQQMIRWIPEISHGGDIKSDQEYGERQRKWCY